MRHRMLIMLFILLSFFSIVYAQPKGIWIDEKSMFVDESRNLQWDLSNLGNWNVVDKQFLGENQHFVAVNEHSKLCVAYLVFPIDEEGQITSVWDIPEEEFQSAMTPNIQLLSTPGVSNKKPTISKIYYLSKEALKMDISYRLNDTIQNTTENCYIQLYLIYKKYEIIQFMVWTISNITQKVDLASFEKLFERVEYIDVEKENEEEGNQGVYAMDEKKLALLKDYLEQQKNEIILRKGLVGGIWVVFLLYTCFVVMTVNPISKKKVYLCGIVFPFGLGLFVALLSDALFQEMFAFVIGASIIPLVVSSILSIYYLRKKLLDQMTDKFPKGLISYIVIAVIMVIKIFCTYGKI